jgi:hypothetical protein
VNVKLLRSVAGQKPGAVLDLDQSSAEWMVRNGYAEHLDQPAGEPLTDLLPEDEAGKQAEALAVAPVPPAKRTRTPRKSQEKSS